MAARALGFLATLLCPIVAMAQQRTPLPEFNGQHVYTVDVANIYAPLSLEIDRVEAASSQKYYVAVVRQAGSGAWAARQYVDDLYNRWRQQAVVRGLKFDADRAVVMVLAVENRQLAVHVGQRLQDELALRGQTIDRELVGPKFTPFAKQGDYVGGLKALVREFELYIAAKEAAVAKQREAATLRAAQVEMDAKATLESARQLQADVRRELADKQKTGWKNAALEQRIEQAGKQFAESQAKLATDAASALATAQQASAALGQVQAELRRLAAVEQQAATALDGVDKLVRQAEDTIDQSGRAGMAVGPLQTRLDEQAQTLASARQSLTSDPDGALGRVKEIEPALTKLIEQAGQLSQTRQQLQQRADTTRQLHDTVAGDLRQAEATGTNVAALTDRLKAIEQPLQDANRLEGTDYAAALTNFESAGDQLRALQTDITQQVAQHRYMTRTLPAAAGLSSIGAMGLVLVGRWIVHRRRKSTVGSELAAFKGQVVELSNALDALKERHKMLPFTDADFTEPMTGETLALYNAAEQAIGQYRQRWLKLMDAWELAQQLLTSQGALGWKQLNEARKALASAGAPDELKAIQKECASPLDRLEQGHEQAEEMIHALDSDRQELVKQLDRIRQATLASAPYQPELDAIASLVEHGGRILRADPIGAQSLLTEARTKVAGLRQCAEAVLRNEKQWLEVESRRQTTSELAAQRRAEGLLLVEVEGNPDRLLGAASDQLRAALDNLNRALPEVAAKHIDEANAAVEQATKAISLQIDARARCAADLPALRAELQRLRADMQTALANQAQLDREFAKESWQNVADHVEHIQELIGQGDRLLAAAAAATADNVQHYFRAQESLDQARKSVHEGESLVAAIAKRLTELRGKREQGQRQLTELRGHAQQIAGLLRANTADRPRSNQRYQAAQQRLNELAAQAALPRADWARLSSQLSAVRAELDESLALAKQDLQLADQAAAEIAEAQRAVVAAKTWYSQGISPDVSAAESRLNEARQLLISQSYEQAISQAGAARQAAQAAQDEAARLVEQRQARLEQSRRRAAIPTLAAGGLAMAGMAPASRPPAAGATPQRKSNSQSDDESRSSQTSWSSESSQTNW